jgi:hypothetical protein
MIFGNFEGIFEELNGSFENKIYEFEKSISEVTEKDKIEKIKNYLRNIP